MYGDKQHGMDLVLSNGLFMMSYVTLTKYFNQTTLLSLENLLIMSSLYYKGGKASCIFDVHKTGLRAQLLKFPSGNLLNLQELIKILKILMI